MSLKYPPINPSYPHFLHGGDYNPDQWTPDVWEQDLRLMKLAGCNAMSVGIFSWVHLEPADGQYTFEWLDVIMDKLAERGARAVLATPSGSKPAWLSEKYPEVCRIGPDGRRHLHAGRHNHCFTSPVYREKTRFLNDLLAKRYQDHPALLVWHLSNEYNGECHCELCYAAFRAWLRQRYEGDLKKLNLAWWSKFWSHDYTAWEQIRPIDGSIHGLMLDWKRFITHQTIDFMRAEIAPLKQHTPTIPVTTNMMGLYSGLDYRRMAKDLDVIAWDNYPHYSDRPDLWQRAVRVSFTHDANRSFRGGQPFMLMESTPSAVNWQRVMKLKRPGVHRLESLQAVAHGSDTVQYFQWRAGRGGSEKFHGAVVAHDGTEKTRVFRDVAEVGAILKQLQPVLGCSVAPEVAIIFDWENRWAIEQSQGPHADRKDYEGTALAHYRPFWQRGVPVDVIGEDDDFARYRVLIAPMLYMVRPGVAERISVFVAAGGTLVTTYWSGIADESDLCFTGGRPGPLRKLLGLWSEELDVLYDDEENHVEMVAGNAAGLSGRYRAHTFCDLVHAEGATVAATYTDEFYAGRPALTVNRQGAGEAWYIAARTDDAFLADFYGKLAARLGLQRVVAGEFPEGVTAQLRTDGTRRFVFLLNFKREPATVALGAKVYADLISGGDRRGSLSLPGYGSVVLEER